MKKAAGSEEMSKIRRSTTSSRNCRVARGHEVKLLPYTEHASRGIGGKQRAYPASEFTDTEIPRPEPNATSKAAYREHKRRNSHRFLSKSFCAARPGKD